MNGSNRVSTTWIVATLAVLCASIGLAAPPAAAAQSAGLPGAADRAAAAAPVSTSEVHHDTSPPLRDLPPAPPAADGSVPPKQPAPVPPAPAAAAAPQALSPVPQSPTPMPPTTANFPGMDNIDALYPPDTNGDVGPNEYVQMINSSLAIFDKTGQVLFGPVAISSLWGGFGG
ncbi:MAG: hypothetical protein ACH36H_09250, partial [Candidatus Nanopelagicales bacterium]